jgi:hypothetical protein
MHSADDMLLCIKIQAMGAGAEVLRACGTGDNTADVGRDNEQPLGVPAQ